MLFANVRLTGEKYEQQRSLYPASNGENLTREDTVDEASLPVFFNWTCLWLPVPKLLTLSLGIRV